MNNIKSEDKAEYGPPIDGDKIIDDALKILRSRMMNSNDILTSPQETKDYITLKIGSLEHEVFGCIFMDNQYKVIKDEIMFRGTIDGASVYPREVAKEALQCNAKALIFYHNHPSGNSQPSQDDETLTNKMIEALKLLEIRVLDHFIIGTEIVSFAELGLI